MSEKEKPANENDAPVAVTNEGKPKNEKKNVYAERESQKEGKLNGYKKKLDCLTDLSAIQAVKWSSDFVLNYETLNTGTLYCPLKKCGRPVKTKRFSNHLLQVHELTGEENAETRDSISTLAEAIADRQRSFYLDCHSIPRNLFKTDDQFAVWKWIFERFEENCIPILHKDVLKDFETDSLTLRRIEEKIDFLVEATKNQNRSTNLRPTPVGVVAKKTVVQPKNELPTEAEDYSQLIDEEGDGEDVDEPPHRAPEGGVEDLLEEEFAETITEVGPVVEEENERTNRINAMFDVSEDARFTNYFVTEYIVKNNDVERRISEILGFWKKLVIERQPVLTNFVNFMKSQSHNRHLGLEIVSGMENYPSYVARFMLFLMRAFQRMGEDVAMDDFINGSNLIRPWFERIQMEGVSASVIKAFCNALTAFANFVRDDIGEGDRAVCGLIETRVSNDTLRLSRITRILNELKRWRRIADATLRLKNSMKGTKSQGREKKDINYAALCRVFRHEQVQKDFSEIRDRFHSGQPLLKKDFDYILQGCVFSAIVFNSARPEAVYKLRAGGVNGDRLRNGQVDENTGLQKVEIGDNTLWASPYPMPKQVVTKSAIAEELRGILIFEESNREWLKLFSEMRKRVLNDDTRATNAELQFFIKYNGRGLKENEVSPIMKRFLRRRRKSGLAIGCNDIRHSVADEVLHNIVHRIYYELLDKYTSNLHEAVALGYLELRRLEERFEEVQIEDYAEMIGSDQEFNDEEPLLSEDDDEWDEDDAHPALDQRGSDHDVEDPLTYPPLQYPRDGGFGSDESLDDIYGRTRTVGEGSENITMEYDDSEDDGDVRAENQNLPQVNMARDLGRDQEMTSERYLEILRDHNENPAEKPLLGWNDSSKDFLARSNAHPIQKWSWLRIADASVAGLGVFAKCDLPKDATICDYRGIMMEVEAHEERMKEAEDGESVAEEFHFRNNYYMEGSVVSKGMRRKFGIESQFPVCDGRVMIGRLINHSKEHPNVEVVAHHKVVAGESKIQVVFVTKRKIKANEEILFDYGTSFSHLSECFCYKCKERSLDAMPKLPESFTMPKPQPSTMLSMSQSDVAEPLRKRVAGYHVRRLIDVFDNNGQLTWSDALPDWPTALSFGIGIFDSKMSVPHGRTAEEHIAHCHEEATRHQELVLVLMKNLELAFVLGKADGSPGVLLQIDSSGVRYAVPKRGRRDQLVQQDLNDMRIVHLHEKTFNEHIDVIRRIPV